MTAICPDCGRSWEDARRGGRLGCTGCWDAFRQELSTVVSELHGSDRQPDDEELATQLLERRRRNLEEELRQALALEDYALAGRIRDQMRNELEGAGT